MQRNLAQSLVVTLKGMAMGAADVVPGVSGGTIAFITGIYDKLLDSINSINFGLLKVIKSEGIGAAWKKVNGNFLVALFLGIGISILALSKQLEYVLETNPVLLWSFFFGLIIASIIYIGKQIKTWNPQAILGLIAGIAVVLALSILPPLGNATSLGYIFICGVIAICAMILPGISGSFLLLILGAYPTVLGALNDRDLLLIGVFMLGALVGLLSFSRVLKWVFKNYENTTLAVLTGFLVGSLYKLWPWRHVKEIYVKHAGEVNEKVVTLVDEPVLPQNYDVFIRKGEIIAGYAPAPSQLGWAILLAITGFLLIFGIEYLGKKMGKQSD